MCSQGSLFGINRCARVTVSVSTLPCWPPARGKLFKGTRCHLGNVWDLSNAQGGALLSPARRSLSSSTRPCSPSPLLTPLLPSLPPCLSLSLPPSFTLGLSSLLSSYKNAVKIAKHIEAESRVEAARGWGERGE